MFQNAFVGDPNVAMVLALAINTSRLEILSLNTNPGLTDTFAAHFFPLLDAPTFHEIHLSETGLTHQSALHIVEYITSPRCQLHILKANGNQLRIRAVRSIIRAARRANYSLLRMELLATGLRRHRTFWELWPPCGTTWLQPLYEPGKRSGERRAQGRKRRLLVQSGLRTLARVSG